MCNIKIPEKRGNILIREVSPNTCRSSSVNKLKPNEFSLGFHLVSIQERADNAAGGYFLIKYGYHDCTQVSLLHDANILASLLNEPQYEALWKLIHNDFVTSRVTHATKISVSQKDSNYDSWSALSVTEVKVGQEEYLIGFFPTIFLEGQVVKLIVDLYGCQNPMASYRGSNSCLSQIECCKESYVTVTEFEFIPKVMTRYVNSDRGLGYWSFNNTLKFWNSFAPQPQSAPLEINHKNITLRLVGDSVYTALFKEFVRGPVFGLENLNISYSGKCFVWAGCSLNNTVYTNADYNVLNSINIASKVADVVIFSFGSHAPFITLDELGHYVDLSLEIMSKHPKVKYIVNGITDVPTKYMLNSFKKTQLCVRNTFVVAHTNKYLKYRYQGIKNARFFDPLYLTLSSWQFSHRMGDPVHFSEAIIYQEWSQLLLHEIDAFEV